MPTDSRLIQRITNKTIEIKSASLSSPTRITRAAYNEDAVEFSREDEQSNEYPETKAVGIPTHRKHKTAPKTSRFARSSNEHINEGLKNISSKLQSKNKDVVVKKPIPKFYEIDYDDDFQLKVIRTPTTYNQDSGEHEDEDFNLDDYDFDVNHDEFSGRGKPLEPRVKNKNTFQLQSLVDSEADIRRSPAPGPTLMQSPLVKTQSKVVPTIQKVISKRDHDVKNDKNLKKAADKMKEDFYDDFTTTKVSTRKVIDVEDEFNDDHSDSKEYYRKSIRYVRSPYGSNNGYTKKNEDKSTVGSRLIGILPLFPSQSISNGNLS